MVILKSTAAAAAGLLLSTATTATALPTNNTLNHIPSSSKSFSLNQISHTLAQPRARNFPAAYSKALGKYKIQVPVSLSKAAESGGATASPEEDDIEYLTPVDVGGTTLNLDIDTGSADLWVFSDELSQKEQSGHSIYKPSSNSSKLPASFWQINYGDGSYASGDVYKDTVSIGGVTAQSQAVEAASEISKQFVQDQNSDGILGLAFKKINTVLPVSQATFFDNVKSDLDSPVFAVTLKHHAPGSYDFGFIDHDKFKGDLAYTKVDTSQGFWNFTAQGYAVGDQQSSTPIVGIADTGTSLVLIDDKIVKAYYKQVQGAKDDEQQGGYTFPCNAKLPPFTVVINGYKAVIPPEHINYSPVSKGSSTCLGGIQSNQGEDFSIFGDVLLKSQYVVFDSEGPRLGFAPQA